MRLSCVIKINQRPNHDKKECGDCFLHYWINGCRGSSVKFVANFDVFILAILNEEIGSTQFLLFSDSSLIHARLIVFFLLIEGGRLVGRKDSWFLERKEIFCRRKDHRETEGEKLCCCCCFSWSQFSCVSILFRVLGFILCAPSSPPPKPHLFFSRNSCFPGRKLRNFSYQQL